MPAPKTKDKVTPCLLFFLSCRRGLEPPEVRARLPILRGLSHSVKWDSEAKKELRSHKEGRKVALPILRGLRHSVKWDSKAKKELRSHKEGRKVALPILRGLSHSVKWDSEAKELSGGVSEACDACTKSKRGCLKMRIER